MGGSLIRMAEPIGLTGEMQPAAITAKIIIMSPTVHRPRRLIRIMVILSNCVGIEADW